MATIPLTVPESVHAAYLVPVAAVDAPPAALLERALALPAAGPFEERAVTIARGFADRGLLVVEAPGPPTGLLPPLDLLEVFGASTDDVRELAAAPESLLVLSPGMLLPGDPLHEVAARTASARLARLLGVPRVVDLFTPRLVPAEHLLADEAGESLLPVADLVLVPQSAGDRGNWLTTKGLGRWGLPELQVVDVPPPVGEVWTSILTGIAATLVERFSEEVARRTVDGEVPAIVEIADLLEVTPTAMAAAYGSRVDDGPSTSATVQFTFDPSADPDTDDFLTVRAPDAFARSAGEFHLMVVHDLFGADEGAIRHTDPDDEGMASAIETARSCLDVARTRFLAGEFQHRTLLIVKYRLEAGDGIEYPWLFVTEWSDPGRLRGSSAVDAESDPSIRVGRPVATTADAVADWGVWVDGDGIVEGGWTNAYLEGRPAPPVPTVAADGDRHGRGRRRWRRG